jgi:hypothetical protein
MEDVSDVVWAFRLESINKGRARIKYNFIMETINDYENGKIIENFK